MTKKQYKVNLDEDVVEKVKIQSMDSKLSPIINSLLKTWISYRDEVEFLFRKTQTNNDTKRNLTTKENII